jgi:hypothetical protein
LRWFHFHQTMRACQGKNARNAKPVFIRPVQRLLRAKITD